MTTPAPASDAASTHYASYGGQEASYGDFTTYGGYDASGFATGAHATTTFESDPLFGNLPGEGQATGAYDTTHWQTGGHQTAHHDPYAAQHHAAYDSGTYDATAWTIPAQATGNDISGQWDANAWLQPEQPAAGPTQQWEWGTQSFDTGAYDATQWNADGAAVSAEPEHHRAEHHPYEEAAYEEAGYEETPYEETSYEDGTYDATSYEDAGYEDGPYDDDSFEETSQENGDLASTGELPAVAPLLDDQEEFTPAPATRAGSRGAARSRRRTPARRSALMTVAVPSACVMGVAGIAAASVAGLTGGDKGTTTTAAAETKSVKPSAANNKLDTQLENLSAGADDFADRASRTQERIDLKAQQVAEKKKAAAEAALKERLRPKFVLPVLQKGLSAYFGQAGVNWMSVHTGIDFPVSYGTTVMSATDGVVSTKWNSAYGNMMIVTAKDGTETWYCHLSSYRVASGTSVKAGDPIAYSGNSGNSTGPHLHFEVRPAGGAAIDPLPWLRSHGLDPT
ncbi:M23 family metallopeptidase [Streptomyces olivochromogenes]|uniref:M23 family metallopeptidase n=1 Tax=Streptomyces olivochromogenes TaxID=1963 RepID=UPI001F204E11|nr:M23 family metallopeptidase [Streptomyces olivochromogenes]